MKLLRRDIDFAVVLAMFFGGLFAVAAAVVAFTMDRGGPAIGKILPESQKVVAEKGQRRVTVSYRVANRGRSELIIQGVETGCGCSVASIERDIIPPGGEGKVVIEATVPPSGERTLDMMVKTNQASQGELPFRLTVVGNETIPHVARSSRVAQFGVIDDSTGSTTITVSSREPKGSEPWITEAVTSVPGLLIRGGLDDERPSGNGVVYRTYHYELSFNERPKPGQVTGEVVLWDGPRAQPVATVPVRGEVKPPVYSTPSALYASVTPDEASSREFRLVLVRVGGGNDFEARLSEPAPGLIVKEDESNAAGRIFVIRIDNLTEDCRGSLVFHTDIEGGKRVEVPYLFKVTPEE